MKKLMVVGIGPGDYEQMTLRAVRALEESDVIIGYAVYVDLLREHFPGKELMTTPMGAEEQRCEMAFAEAEKGRTTAMVCSGDAGVYGMAGLILEMGLLHPAVDVEIIPGVTAALSGGALLGAPLIHDFCVISLSDRLTPWEIIEKRLRLAAQADMTICLYNPSSHARKDYLRKACEIVLWERAPETVCGIACSIGREGETFRVLTLEELKGAGVDMFTTVFIGNSQTKRVGERMVTPRGYRSERGNLSTDTEK